MPASYSRCSFTGLTYLLFLLARLRHPNICLFLGASLSPPNRSIITELVSRGSLWDVLRTPNLFSGDHAADRSYWALPSRVAQRVLKGCCAGLIYLHGLKPNAVIHRDLKSANILLDESFHPKVC